jgi:hypothetical protein
MCKTNPHKNTATEMVVFLYESFLHTQLPNKKNNKKIDRHLSFQKNILMLQANYSEIELSTLHKSNFHTVAETKIQK